VFLRVLNALLLFIAPDAEVDRISGPGHATLRSFETLDGRLRFPTFEGLTVDNPALALS
jgi:hypothetical protein